MGMVECFMRKVPDGVDSVTYQSTVYRNIQNNEEEKEGFEVKELRPEDSEVTEWKPLDDLCGLLTQIDNMVCGLRRNNRELEENMIKHEGKNLHRLNNNPNEMLLHNAWKTENKQGHILEYLLGDNNRRGDVSERDALVAATVIQWLGSPVGSWFLRDAYQSNDKDS